MPYLPQPPRTWSRVQSRCTFLNPNDDYAQVISGVTNRGKTLAQADYQEKLLYKGNILQYKGNSSRLTKKQKYTQLAKGFGPGRTKVFATQTETYTNPNTTGFLRVGSTTIPYPNFLVGQPNNPSGPYLPNAPNPDNCNTNGSLEDGGTLVCGFHVKPCTNEVISVGKERGDIICNPSTASDVPGIPIALCWDPAFQTWFPKPRYFMNNSTDKWPVNYKGFVSAIKPAPPVIKLTDLTLTWTYVNSCVVPINSFRIYVNGQFFTSFPYTTTSYTFSSLQTTDTIYMTSVSGNIESDPSNIVNFKFNFTTTGSPTIQYNNNYYTITFTSNGTITFSSNVQNITILAAGGGGGGGGGEPLVDAAGGGGGGGGIGILNTSLVSNNIYTIVVGAGGDDGLGANSGGPGGDSSFKYNTSNFLTATGGGGGAGWNAGTGGGSGGTANSIFSISSYNGGAGGQGYRPSFSAQNGNNTSPAMPITLPNGQSYYFSGGGGGGTTSPTRYGGNAGLNGVGGALGAYNNSSKGQTATSYGSGGGGAGRPASSPSTTGGFGAQGVVIVQFFY